MGRRRREHDAGGSHQGREDEQGFDHGVVSERDSLPDFGRAGGVCFTNRYAFPGPPELSPKPAREKDYARCSASRRATAARSSGMPAPVSDEVASTPGKAAGCLARASRVAATQSARAFGFISSALVSTIW
jgi:hypothetical protein